MRAFVAVDIPDCEAFSRLRNLLSKEDVKIVSPELYHINLKFLGELTEEKLQDVGSALSEVALKFSHFKITFQGAGQFPPNGRARVLFVPASSAILQSVFSELEEALEKKGVPKERRPYFPHLTICRVKSGRPSLPPTPKVTVDINKLKIKRSILTPSGPIYTTIHEEQL